MVHVYCGCSCRCYAAALVLLLCTCCYYTTTTAVLFYCCCSCSVCDMFLLLIPVSMWLLCKSPPLGDVYPHLEAERPVHLLRKLYEYRLVIDILFGILAEISCQLSFRTMRTCTLCCCFCLLLLSFLHQRNRRRFVQLICSIDCCCRSTNCFVAICKPSI